ncbi:unnamed protein product [Meganyctiphanes norvegica]|uniref:Uncharacterized protein n=1 Tax=Meganyctiphanes norvegica TaxID=48144 RepID=A0AAV2PP84_MEGNR
MEKELSVAVGEDLIKMSKTFVAAGNRKAPRGGGATSGKQGGRDKHTSKGDKQSGRNPAGTGGGASGSGDDPNDDRNNPRRIFDGLRQFKQGNPLYERLREWLEGILENLLRLGQTASSCRFILTPLNNQVNPHGESALQQFGFTQLLEYTMSNNTLVTLPMSTGLAQPTKVNKRPMKHSEELLLSDRNDPLTIGGNQNGTVIAVIYTQNFTCQAQRGRICSCFDRVTRFAQQNPGAAIFVMYSQPWPRSEGCWFEQMGRNEQFLNDHQLPPNIAFIEVDFIISQNMRNISIMSMRLTGRRN